MLLPAKSLSSDGVAGYSDDSLCASVIILSTSRLEQPEKSSRAREAGKLGSEMSQGGNGGLPFQTAITLKRNHVYLSPHPPLAPFRRPPLSRQQRPAPAEFVKKHAVKLTSQEVQTHARDCDRACVNYTPTARSNERGHEGGLFCGLIFLIFAPTFSPW